MYKTFLVFLLFLSQTALAQFHFGVFAGASNYAGDLNEKIYNRTKFAAGISLNYEVSDRVMLRSGLTLGKLEGGDKYSGNQFLVQNRNLDFQSAITEFSLLGEVTVFNLYNINWSPYYFAGIAVYHFNPYTIDSSQKVYLQPLGTEGQGLAAYPDRKRYALTQFAIPFGGGIKFRLSDNVRLGVEVGLRKTFTDHLDDVGGTYADYNDLLAGNGPKAVELAYRGNGSYPSKNDARGNSGTKDWYYFTGVHLTFRLGGGYGKTDASRNKRGYGCPGNPM